MALYDLHCACGYTDEAVLYGDIPECPKCGEELVKDFPLIAYVKMKGDGGYPSRRKQIFNTTYRKHPKLT